MRASCRPAERAVIMSSCHHVMMTLWSLVMTSVSWWEALGSGPRYSLPASDPTVRGMPSVQSLRHRHKTFYCEKKAKECSIRYSGSKKEMSVNKRALFEDSPIFFASTRSDHCPNDVPIN